MLQGHRRPYTTEFARNKTSNIESALKDAANGRSPLLSQALHTIPSVLSSVAQSARRARKRTFRLKSFFPALCHYSDCDAYAQP
uniref:Transposase n=1 Tax=Steinernema glaseri TaxID=37863 RepID=A0A1I7Y9R6_9BILA